VALSGTQWHSVALSVNQYQSVSISVNSAPQSLQTQRVEQRSSWVIRAHQYSSVAIDLP
jgi:hypothetical protein